jgi:hypothetical protein
MDKEQSRQLKTCHCVQPTGHSHLSTVRLGLGHTHTEPCPPYPLHAHPHPNHSPHTCTASATLSLSMFKHISFFTKSSSASSCLWHTVSTDIMLSALCRPESFSVTSTLAGCRLSLTRGNGKDAYEVRGGLEAQLPSDHQSTEVTHIRRKMCPSLLTAYCQ